MRKIPHLLLIEDDAYFAHFITQLLDSDFNITWCQDPKVALNEMRDHVPDVIMSDLDLGSQVESGLDFLGHIQHLTIPKIIMSSHLNEDCVEKAYLLGATHYLTKRDVKTHLKPYLETTLVQHHVDQYLDQFTKIFQTQNKKLIGHLEQILSKNLKLRSLLITGETGTGKTLIASAIHRLLFPSDAPFIAINCSEIAEDLMESELFGHKKGAFTGAHENKIGKLKLAHHGIIFLDEIGTMSLRMQQKLLKAIEEKSFYPVGSHQKEESHFTLISATCDSLPQMIKDKNFREDFYFRINQIQLHIPPLRERKEDIQLIIQRYLSSLPRKIILKPCAEKLLIESAWPGNTRELFNVLREISETHPGIIYEKDLLKMKSFSPTIQSSPELEFDYQKICEVGLKNYIRMMEKKIIDFSIQRHQNKVVACIDELKISNSAFYRILNH